MRAVVTRVSSASVEIDGSIYSSIDGGLLVLLGVSTAKYNHVEIRSWFLSQGIWLQYVIILGAVFFILVFGIYGSNYDASQFIYFQF